jgi:hypothetical protein
MTTTNNKIQVEQLNQAHRNLEDLDFRIAKIALILEPMATDTATVINKKFWDKYFLVKPAQKNDGDDWSRKPYHEFELLAPRYSFEKGQKRINLGRTEHPTRYDGTENDWGARYGDYYDVLVPSDKRVEIVEALQKEIEKLITWRVEKLEEIEKLGQVDEVQLRADLIAVYEKHGRPAGVWDKMLDSRDLSSYNLND